MSLAVLPSHEKGAHKSALGWLSSTAVAALLVSAISAVALSNQTAGTAVGEAEDVIFLALAPMPAIEAIAEPSPDLIDQAPAEQVDTPEVEDTPDLTELETPDVAVDEPDLAEPVIEDMPEIEPPPVPAVVHKPEPKPKKEKPVEKKKAEKPVEKKKPVDKKKDQAKKPPSEAQAEQKASRQQAQAQSSVGAGKAANKSYAASVMKKVQKTRKQRAGEKGTAVVAFTVAANGGLQSVKITRSSGSAKVDQVALDHIKRAAPFPVPPEGVGRSFSFDFIAK